MNSNANNNNLRNQNKKPVSKSKNKSAFTENWVRVKSIKNGIITLPNKEMITGVKIEPRNIFILDPISQDNVINALRNCYNTFNFEFWLIAADRPVDISVYTSQLELMLSDDSIDMTRKKIIIQDLDKADMFINNQVVDTEYYVLFKESRPDVLQDKLRTMINGFASCSLIVTPTTDDDLRIILDGFLNGGVRSDFGTAVVGG